MKTAEFYNFMHERESIRLKKAAHLPKPWTKDKIFQRYSFTNVKRCHDRTSAALITEFYQPHYNDAPELLLLNCGIARYFGTIDFMRAVGWQTDFKPQRLIKAAAERLGRGEQVYTGAYIITNNGLSGPKEDVVAGVFLADLWRHHKEILAIRGNEYRWEPFIRELRQCTGFGGTGFMAKEVTNDTRYTSIWPEGTPIDKDEWVPVGPGSMRGAATVTGRYGEHLNEKETLEVCRTLFAQRAEFWPKDYEPLELSDIQFQLCEYQKYQKTKRGDGRPRKRYPGSA